MIDGGIYTPDTEISEAIDEYISDAENMSESTYDKRNRILKDNIAPIVEEYNIQKINDWHPDHFQEYVDLRRNEGVSDVSISNEINHIQGLIRKYNYYEFLQFFERSELDLSTRTNVEKKAESIPSISEKEYRTLLRECDSLRNELIFRIGWETGVRRSEMAKIDISDIDGDEITIDSAKKQDEEERTVFLDLSTESKVQQYIRTERKSYASHADTDALLITSSGRIHAHTINNIIVRTAERAGIQETIGTDSDGNELNRITSHSLRHSFALKRLEEGMNIKYISQIMGDTVQSVSETYLQTDKDALKKANKENRPNPYSEI